MTGIIAWLDPSQAEFVRRIADAAGATIVRAGTPGGDRCGSAAQALGVESSDDLRTDLTDADCDLILIASPGEFGLSDRADAEALRAARSRDVRVATLEPMPASAFDLPAGWSDLVSGVAPSDCAATVPLIRHSPVFRDAAEVIEQFGSVRTLLVDAFCARGQVSLGTLMFNAFDAAAALLGEPDTVAAAYTGEARGSGVHALPGESLRGLSGDMSAIVRYADGRSACVRVSDGAGGWARSVTLLGDAGRVTITDDALLRLDPDGRIEDDSVREQVSSEELVADAIKRMLDTALPEARVFDQELALSLCQVALLSARTGQAESPATIRRMVEISG